MIFHALTTSFATYLTLIGMKYGFLAHPLIYNAKFSCIISEVMKNKMPETIASIQ